MTSGHSKRQSRRRSYQFADFVLMSFLLMGVVGLLWWLLSDRQYAPDLQAAVTTCLPAFQAAPRELPVEPPPLVDGGLLICDDRGNRISLPLTRDPNDDLSSQLADIQDASFITTCPAEAAYVVFIEVSYESAGTYDGGMSAHRVHYKVTVVDHASLKAIARWNVTGHPPHQTKYVYDGTFDANVRLLVDLVRLVKPESERLPTPDGR